MVFTGSKDTDKTCDNIMDIRGDWRCEGIFAYSASTRSTSGLPSIYTKMKQKSCA